MKYSILSLLFVLLFALDGQSQNLQNNTSCSVSVVGVDCITVHYQCNPACGNGAYAGPAGNCCGAPTMGTANSPGCCTPTSMTVNCTVSPWLITP